VTHKEYAKKHEFDSVEEMFFFHWCEEAFDQRLIGPFHYSQQTYEIVKPQENNKKHLFRATYYSDDFQLKIRNLKFAEYLEKNKLLILPNPHFVVDVKGGKTKKEIKNYRSFQIRRKLMWQVHNIYVNIIAPNELFEKTWQNSITSLCSEEDYKYKPISNSI